MQSRHPYGYFGYSNSHACFQSQILPAFALKSYIPIELQMRDMIERVESLDPSFYSSVVRVVVGVVGAPYDPKSIDNRSRTKQCHYKLKGIQQC